MNPIFAHDSLLTYLASIKNKHPASGKKITLKRWSERLAYRSPRLLAMILRGERRPSRKFSDSIHQDLSFSATERRYFDLLVQKDICEAKLRNNFDRAKILAQLDSIGAELATLRPKNKLRRELSSEVAGKILHWASFVIKQLVATKGFRENPEWISRRLMDKLSPTEVRERIECLISYGLLERGDGCGALQIPQDGEFMTKYDIPSRAIRRYHKETLQRAQEALDAQGLNEREFLSNTTRIQAKDLPAAKERLRSFLKEFDLEFFCEEADEVYSLNLNLFRQTEPEYAKKNCNCRDL